jgi:hypothetical protein
LQPVDVSIWGGDAPLRIVGETGTRNDFVAALRQILTSTGCKRRDPALIGPVIDT